MKVETIRTSRGLRELLFEELDKLRSGEAAPARVNAIAKSAAQIIATVRLEMDHAKLDAQMGKARNEIGILQPIKLS